MPASATIVDLRALLAEKFPQTAVKTGNRLPTGLQQIDGPLGGGLPAGKIVEVVGGQGTSGAGLLITALLAKTAADNQAMALVDGADRFDPQPMEEALLRHLLWVRCVSAAEALKAADLLLRDGNLPLVVLDLRGVPEKQLRKIPATMWYRFQRIAEQGTVAFVIVTSRPTAPSAEVRLRVSGRFTLDAIDLPHERLIELLDIEVVRMQSAGRHVEAG